MHQDLPENLLEDILNWADSFPEKLDDLEGLLTENRIFKQRNVGIGIVSKNEAIELGFSGVMLRGSGVPWDLRRSQPYETYSDYKFSIPIGKNGDCYDRYLLRIQEMRESANIIKQALKKLEYTTGDDVLVRGKFTPPKRNDMKNSMEALIHHFKLYTEGFRVPKGSIYSCVEAPKGEFGVFIVSDGTNQPYRVKLRAPGFVHLSAMEKITKGHQLADVSAILGSLDIVFGEIDR